jgi:hypothetical protein
LTPTAGSNFSRYIIPDELAPTGICCVSVPVPDDPDWRAQFLGALWRLTLQTHYERNAAKSGKVVAARWLQVYEDVRDSMSECQRPNIISNTAITATLRLALRLEFVANGLDGIAPDRPDTFFDEDSGDAGDEIQQRSNALCSACYDYVNTISQDIWDIAFSTGLTVALTATPILFAINPLAAAIAALAASVITQEVLNAVESKSNRIKVACCMYENMQGLAVTQANFEASLAGCGFTPLSQVEIMRDAIEATLNDSGNWYAFVSQLGGFFAASGIASEDCICNQWEHTFDFTIDQRGWAAYVASGPTVTRAKYDAGVGWGNFDNTTHPGKGLIQITHPAFTSTHILEADFTIDAPLDGGAGELMRLAAPNVNGAEFDELTNPGVNLQGTVDIDAFGSGLWLSIKNNDDNDLYTGHLTKLVLCGDGVDPFP